MLVVFGGMYDFYGDMNSDLLIYDFFSDSWSDTKASGDVPTPRRRHCAVAVGGKSMYVFGGIGGKINRDMYLYNIGLSFFFFFLKLSCFNLDTHSFSSVLYSGSIPAPRFGHTCSLTSSGSEMIIFGGQGDSSFFNDVFSFNFGKIQNFK